MIDPDEQTEQIWHQYLDGRPVELRNVLVEIYAERLPEMVRAVSPDGEVNEDRTSAAVIALIRAIDTYEADRGTAFKTWLWSHVRGAVLDQIQGGKWFSPKRGRDAPEVVALATVADALSEDPETAAEHVLAVESLANYEATLRALDAEAALLGDAEALHRALAMLVACLPSRERRVLWRKYFHEMKLADIGKQLGVGKSRTSQIHCKGLRRLRGLLQGTGVIDAIERGVKRLRRAAGRKDKSAREVSERTRRAMKVITAATERALRKIEDATGED